MFTHMIPIRKEEHSVRDEVYELLLYRVKETGEVRIYVAKEGFGIGDIYSASQEIIHDVKVLNDEDIIEHLIRIAKSDIDRNLDDKYTS